MVVTTYTPDTPIASHTPANDQPQMLANFQYLIPGIGSNPANLTGVQRDHNMTLLSSTPGDGTHRQVTFNNLAASPGFTGANCVLYSKVAQAVSCLFFDNNGTPVQLSSVPPVITTTGGTWLPGGLLMIWGTGSGTTGATINFHTKLQNPAFSNPALFVSVVATSGPPGNGSAGVVGGSISATSFRILNTSGVAGSFNFMYIAIGPA